MKKNQQTTAEAYRDERKSRIAKANKKNAKGGHSAGRFFKKLIAVVLCIAVVCGVVYVAATAFGLDKSLSTAIKVGDIGVSSRDFYYYYSTMYQQTSYYASYYSQYGYDMGYDSSLAPDAQTTTDEDGNEITWAQSFLNSAEERAQFVTAFYTEATRANFELSQEKKDEIDKTIDDYKSSASENGFALGAYLRSSFCPGFTVKAFRKLLEKDTIASAYHDKLKEDEAAAVSEEDINKEYKENGKEYDYADAVYYSVDREVLEAKDGETEKQLQKRQDSADKALKDALNKAFNKVSDKDAFVAAAKDYEKANAEEENTDAAAEVEETADAETAEQAEETDPTSSLDHTSFEGATSAIGEDGAEWLYGTSKKGSLTVVENGDKFCVVLCLKARYAGNSVDWRNILVSIETDENGESTDENKEAALKKAESLLKQIKESKNIEDTISSLAPDNSADTTSASEGGLYEATRYTDTDIDSDVRSWLFDDSRKEGDIEIVETSSGYQIVYLSKINAKDFDWAAKIRENIGEERFEEKEEKILADDGSYVVTETMKGFWANRVMDAFCGKIKKNLAYSNSKK
ncbi:MAG: peptidyl-prolyl cis-trans isomerase [Clostridiales bacterium]|nr:peptidyl-prolyl cis-trans isomerase [Clostridiales bacterium]